MDLSNNNVIRLPEQILQFKGFNQLSELDLSHNLISKEIDVMAVAELPSITKLILFGNPVVRKDRGLPLIQERLVDARAVTVVVEHQVPQKPPIVVAKKMGHVAETLRATTRETALSPEVTATLAELAAAFPPLSEQLESSFFLTQVNDMFTESTADAKPNIDFPSASALHAFKPESDMPSPLRAMYELENDADEALPVLNREAAVNALRYMLRRKDAFHLPGSEKTHLERATAAYEKRVRPPLAARLHREQAKLRAQPKAQTILPSKEELTEKKVQEVETLLEALQKQLSAVESNFQTVILGNQRMQREKEKRRQSSGERRPSFAQLSMPRGSHEDDVEVLFATLKSVQQTEPTEASTT